MNCPYRNYLKAHAILSEAIALAQIELEYASNSDWSLKIGQTLSRLANAQRRSEELLDESQAQPVAG